MPDLFNLFLFVIVSPIPENSLAKFTLRSSLIEKKKRPMPLQWRLGMVPRLLDPMLMGNPTQVNKIFLWDPVQFGLIVWKGIGTGLV